MQLHALVLPPCDCIACRNTGLPAMALLRRRGAIAGNPVFLHRLIRHKGINTW